MIHAILKMTLVADKKRTLKLGNGYISVFHFLILYRYEENKSFTTNFKFRLSRIKSIIASKHVNLPKLNRFQILASAPRTSMFRNCVADIHTHYSYLLDL